MSPEELKSLIHDTVTETLQSENTVLGKEELRQLMHDAVVDAMSTLGIDARNPMDVQRDMQFVRELRLTSDRVKHKALLTLIGVLVVAGASAIWLGIKAMVA